MKGFTASTESGELICFVDHKRYLWLMSVTYPLLPFLGIWAHSETGNEWWLLLPFFLSYVVAPLLDWILGEDSNNPPEAVVPALNEDKYYRYLTYAIVPLHFLTLVGVAWWAATQDLSWWAFVGLAAVAGIAAGLGINTGHELGHKKDSLERWLSKITLAQTFYGHFYIEHNRGHHRDVATPEDPASSRMGESIYRFVFREMPGAFFRAWDLEAQRLERCGKSVWSLDNEVLQPALISAVLYGGLIAWLGIEILPVMLLIAFWGAFQLTLANYIEHYGLLRRKEPSGRYERCQPHHSWNSNHLFSNWALFHLQRHSDHHAHPTRRYQSLRDFPDLPRLPSGYFGMYLLTYFPPLWFKVMDKRLLDAVGRDPSRINFLPAKREMLMRRYGLVDAAAPEGAEVAA